MVFVTITFGAQHLRSLLLREKRVRWFPEGLWGCAALRVLPSHQHAVDESSVILLTLSLHPY